MGYRRPQGEGVEHPEVLGHPSLGYRRSKRREGGCTTQHRSTTTTKRQHTIIMRTDDDDNDELFVLATRKHFFYCYGPIFTTKSNTNFTTISRLLDTVRDGFRSHSTEFNTAMYRIATVFDLKNRRTGRSSILLQQSVN